MKFSVKEIKEKLKKKYRIVVLDNNNFEEKLSLRWTLFSFLAAIIATFVLFIALTILFVWLTPIKEYIPGYGGQKQSEQIFTLYQKVDSLNTMLLSSRQYEQSFKAMILGEDSSDTEDQETEMKQDSLPADSGFFISKVDSLLLKMNILKPNKKSSIPEKLKVEPSETILYYTPFRGVEQAAFSSQTNGVDFLCNENTSIYTIAAGVVVSVQENKLIIQHPQNMITIYTFDAATVLLEGQVVRAKEMIAKLDKTQIVHFELWMNGMPIDPDKYILF